MSSLSAIKITKVSNGYVIDMDKGGDNHSHSFIFGGESEERPITFKVAKSLEEAFEYVREFFEIEVGVS